MTTVLLHTVPDKIAPARVVKCLFQLAVPALLALFAVAAAPSVAHADAVNLSGDYANQTSAIISREAFPEGSDWAIVVRDDDFADAMSATGLAGTLHCPILVTNPDSLSTATAYELGRLRVSRVYVIGGHYAVSDNVVEGIADLGAFCGAHLGHLQLGHLRSVRPEDR